MKRKKKKKNEEEEEKDKETNGKNVFQTLDKKRRWRKQNKKKLKLAKKKIMRMRIILLRCWWLKTETNYCEYKQTNKQKRSIICRIIKSNESKWYLSMKISIEWIDTKEQIRFNLYERIERRI